MPTGVSEKKKEAREIFPIKVKVDRKTFQNLYGSIGGGLGFLQQLAENSWDALATQIHISVDDANKVIVVTDNGKGMGSRGREAFLSMGLSYKENPRAKGKYGTGAKSVFKVASSISVQDRCERDDLGKDHLVQFNVTEDDILARYETTCTDAVNGSRGVVPEEFPETGVRITISGFKPRAFPRSATVIDNLSDTLAPYVADMIRVNNQELSRREIIGERIKHVFEGEEVQGLERVEVDIYIPSKRVEMADRLRMGAIGPVCDFGDFARQIIDPSQKRMIPRILMDPNVCGIVDVPVFNKLCSSQDRHKFDSSLFTEGNEDLQAFLIFLNFKLAPMLEKVLGNRASSEAEDDIEEVIDDLISLFHNTYGVPTTLLVEGKPPVPQNDLVLNIRNIEMVAGESQEFYVKKYRRGSGQFIWDATGAGGSVNPTHGNGTIFTAGLQTGENRLVVRDKDYPDIEAGISITIVREKSFILNPSSVCLTRGEQVRVKAKNLEVTSGDFRWRADGGQISANTGTEIVFTAGVELGKFNIICQDLRRRSISAECRVEVVSARKEHRPVCGPVKEIPDFDRFIIEDRSYAIQPSDIPGTLEITTMTRGNDTIYISWGHPMVEKARRDGKSATRYFLLTHVILQHVMSKYEEESSAKQIVRLGQISAELVKVGFLKESKR